MTFVKICGITRGEDAEAACELGANALGFNFYAKSPRVIAPAAAKTIIAAMPAGVWKVGVFVNHSREEIAAIAAEAGLDTIQLHGDEPVEFCRGWQGLRVVKALRIGAGAPEYDVTAYAAVADYLLLDRFTSGDFGGTGKVITDDGIQPFADANLMPRVILAGGITPKNAAERIAKWRPFGIDTASGVESAPGVKSSEMITALLKTVR